jgi:hypothetical protein
MRTWLRSNRRRRRGRVLDSIRPNEACGAVESRRTYISRSRARMIYLLKILAILGVNTWLITGTYRRLTRGQFGRAWHICFFVLSCAGLGLGIWFLSIRQLVSPTSRVYGIPFCIAGGDFLEGRWMDGGVGRFLFFAVLADIGCGLSLCLLPLAVGSFIHRRRVGTFERET